MPLLVLALTLGLKLQGSGECPSPGSVRDALAALGDAANDEGPSATIAPAADGVRVTLSADGRHLERLLPPSADCQALARAAAVTLAVWDAELSPAKRGVVSRGASEDGVDFASETPPWQLSLGAAAGGAFAAEGSGLAVELLGLVGRPGRIGVVTASLRFDGLHQTPLGTATALWSREAFGVGGGIHPTLGAFELLLGAEALVGAIEVDGRDFAVGYHNVGVDLGLAALARVTWTRFRVAPFVGIQGVAWFLGRQVHADGSGATANLSTLEGWAEAGGVYRF